MIDAIKTFFAMFSSLFRTGDKLIRSGEALSDWSLESSEMIRDRAKLTNRAERIELKKALDEL